MNRLAEIGRERDWEIAIWAVWTKKAAAKGFCERFCADTLADERLMTRPIADR